MMDSSNLFRVFSKELVNEHMKFKCRKTLKIEGCIKTSNWWPFQGFQRSIIKKAVAAGVEQSEDGVATAMTVLQSYKLVNEEGGGNTSSMDLMDFQGPFNCQWI